MIRQVFEGGNKTVGMLIAKTLIGRFFEVYRDIKSPSKHASLYRRKFILSGKKIRYYSDGKKKRCRVLGVDSETFSLVCETPSGKTFKISSPSAVIIPDKIK